MIPLQNAITSLLCVGFSSIMSEFHILDASAEGCDTNFNSMGNLFCQERFDGAGNVVWAFCDKRTYGEKCCKMCKELEGVWRPYRKH